MRERGTREERRDKFCEGEVKEPENIKIYKRKMRKMKDKGRN